MFLQRKIQPAERFEDFSATIDSPEKQRLNETITRILAEIRGLLIKARGIGCLKKMRKPRENDETCLIASMTPAKEGTVLLQFDTLKFSFKNPSPHGPAIVLGIKKGTIEEMDISFKGGLFGNNKEDGIGSIIIEGKLPEPDGNKDLIQFPKKDDTSETTAFLLEFSQRLKKILAEEEELKQLQIEAYLGILRTPPCWL